MLLDVAALAKSKTLQIRRPWRENLSGVNMLLNPLPKVFRQTEKATVEIGEQLEIVVLEQKGEESSLSGS